MNTSAQFHTTWQKLTAGLPVAIEAVDFMGAKLPPGPESGKTKLAAVLAGVAPLLSATLELAEAAAAPESVGGQAVVGVINAAVALRNLWAHAAQPVAAPQAESSESVAGVRPTDSAPPAEDPARPYTLPEGATEIKPGVIDKEGVRLVWDYQSKGWTTPS